MPSIEEIKAFAEAEGFKERDCWSDFVTTSDGCIGTDCSQCGGKNVLYVMHGVDYPQAAIVMMMTDRARREEIAAAAKAASAALHHARGQNDFAERERGLNEVNQQLMKIWTTAQGARIE